MPSIGVFVLLVLSMAFWGLNFPLAQLVVTDLPPLEAAAGRFVIAALVMLAVAVARGLPVPMLRHARSLGLIGVLGMAGFNLLFFIAMQRTTPVNGALIMGTNPLVTAILAALMLGERPSFRQLLALPVALAGVSAVVLGSGVGATASSGDALMLAANLVWAGYNVAVRRFMPTGDAFANTTVMMVWSALALSVTALISGGTFAMPGAVAGVSLLMVALAGTVLAYLFYNAGISSLGAGRAALFMNLVPVWAMAASIALGNIPSGIQLLGGATVIGSVCFAMMPARRPAVA